MADQSRNDLEPVSNGHSGDPPHALSIEEKRDAASLPRRRRHRVRNCCICCGITFALVVIVIVILVFTVFKQKQPEIHVNSISLNNFRATFNGLIPSVNVTLGVDVTVKNPNAAGFKYTNGIAYMYYHGEQVGESPIPPGEIGAHGTEDVITSVTIMASNLLTNSFLLSDFISGVLPFSVTTDISGRVNILNIFKHHVRVSSVCTVSVSISSASIQQTDCNNQVKL